MGNNCFTELAEWEQMNHESFLAPQIIKRDEESVDILERFAHYDIYENRFGSTETVVNEIDEISQEEPCALLLPQSKLQQGMLSWPQKEFSDKLCVEAKFGAKVYKSLVAGHRAIDFNLLDTKGNAVTLSSLLKTKPVLLTSGQISCPHFQQSVSAMNEFGRRYGPAVHLVCVSSMQPFPAHPDSSYISGKAWETTHTQLCGAQPRNYEDRVNLANKVKKQLAGWTVLVDDLPNTRTSKPDLGEHLVNPYWSTYGPAERATYLIDQSGLIAASQLWFNEESMGEEIQKLCSVDIPSVGERSFLSRVGEAIKNRTASSSSLNSLIAKERTEA
mmetsp:Transcript_27454/g.35992  ORF Transcript_27454/g.35992 Transcript_27454/m.35992 type:complete len:331 (-) Transcript_27454:381-1373(-)